MDEIYRPTPRVERPGRSRAAKQVQDDAAVDRNERLLLRRWIFPS
jgi:hypothetical protein